MLDLLQGIVMQSMARLHEASNVKVLDDNAIYTPFAIKAFNSEYGWAYKYVCSHDNPMNPSSPESKKYGEGVGRNN